MKKFILFALLVLPFGAFAQNNVVENFYQKYKNYDEVTNVTLKGWLLKVTSTITAEEDAKDILNKITYFRALVMEDGNLVKKGDYNSLMKSIKKDKFEELIKVREGKSDIEILVKDDKDFITDAILLVNDEDQFILLSMEGRFKLSDFQHINIDIDGADHFKKAAQ